MGRLSLKGLFDILILQLYSLVNHFGLESRREVFWLSTLVSSSITRLSVIFYLHLSSLTLYALHLLPIVYVYALKSSSSLLHSIYSYSTLS